MLVLINWHLNAKDFKTCTKHPELLIEITISSRKFHLHLCVILFYYFMALWKTCQWLVNGILWRDICALCTLHNWRLSQACDSLQYTAVLDSCPLIYSMSQKVHNLQINIVCPSTFSYLANNYVQIGLMYRHRFTSSPDHTVSVFLTIHYPLWKYSHIIKWNEPVGLQWWFACLSTCTTAASDQNLFWQPLCTSTTWKKQSN